MPGAASAPARGARLVLASPPARERGGREPERAGRAQPDRHQQRRARRAERDQQRRDRRADDVEQLGDHALERVSGVARRRRRRRTRRPRSSACTRRAAAARRRRARRTRASSHVGRRRARRSTNAATAAAFSSVEGISTAGWPKRSTSRPCSGATTPAPSAHAALADARLRERVRSPGARAARSRARRSRSGCARSARSRRGAGRREAQQLPVATERHALHPTRRSGAIRRDSTDEGGSGPPRAKTSPAWLLPWIDARRRPPLRPTGVDRPRNPSLMEKFVIEGGVPLSGTIVPAGNKNARAAAAGRRLLTDERGRAAQRPADPRRRGDARPARATSASRVELARRQRASRCSADGDHRRPTSTPTLAERIRASFLLAGPLLARFGARADAAARRRRDRPPPARPAPRRLPRARRRGRARPRHPADARPTAACAPCDFFMDEPSVMGTENALMAAALTPGDDASSATPPPSRTCRTSRACSTRWARRSRASAPTSCTSTASSALGGCEHTVAPDHIEIGSFMALAGVTGGELRDQGLRRPRTCG